MAVTRLSDEAVKRFLSKEFQAKLTGVLVEGWETLERLRENTLSQEEFKASMKKLADRIEALDAKARIRNIQAQEDQE